jgi:6-phosphogluconolactonase/glucosamine-6-phosphate isomerase/deaminase
VAAALDRSRLVLFFGDERLVEEKTLPRRLHELVPQR